MHEAETAAIVDAMSTIEALRSQISYRRTATGGFEPPAITIPTAAWHIIVSGMEEYCRLTENDLSDGALDNGQINQPARAFKAVEDFNQSNLYSASGTRFSPETINLPTYVWHELQLLSALV
ncbi:hypothetical protein [Azospirillum endophyticum]